MTSKLTKVTYYIKIWSIMTLLSNKNTHTSRNISRDPIYKMSYHGALAPETSVKGNVDAPVQGKCCPRVSESLFMV